MAEPEQTQSMLANYKEKFARRKASLNPRERIDLTRELTELEQQIRARLKTDPVPEPLGRDLLEKVGAKMTELGFEIFAFRITGQHYRHPMSVPFQDLSQLREYISAHLDDETMMKIPELKAKKKLFGLF